MDNQTRLLRSNDEDAFFLVYDSWSDLKKKENRIFQSKAELLKDLLHGVVYGHFIDEELCGFATLAHAGPAWEIHLILVKNQQQGKGVASTLIDAVIKDAVLSHIPEIWLEVYNRNSRAIDLYKRKRFVPQRLRMNYYRDGSAALNMLLDVEASRYLNLAQC